MEYKNRAKAGYRMDWQSKLEDTIWKTEYRENH